MKLMIGIIIVTFIAPLITAQAKVIGQFQVVKGDVSLVSKRGRKKKARFGMRVKEGQTVETSKDSRAKVVMLDKNVIYVSPDSRMKFDKYDQKVKASKETVIDVVYGKIRTKVKQKYDDDKTKFRVQTKAAVAGVRGTDWLTSYQPQNQQTEFITFEGTIEVGLVGPDGDLTNSTLVGPGQSTNFGLGEIPSPPQNVPQQEWDSQNQESDIEGGSETYDPSLPDDSSDSPGQGGGGGENEGGGSPGYSGDSFSSGTEIATDDLESIENDIGDQIDPYLDDQVELADIPLIDEFCDFCRETVEDATANILININLED